MTPALLRKELEAAGIVVLEVGRHHSDETVAIVYLHGAIGQWIDEYALQVVRAIPGVRAAAESVRTPAIILAWLET